MSIVMPCALARIMFLLVVFAPPITLFEAPRVIWTPSLELFVIVFPMTRLPVESTFAIPTPIGLSRMVLPWMILLVTSESATPPSVLPASSSALPFSSVPM